MSRETCDRGEIVGSEQTLTFKRLELFEIIWKGNLGMKKLEKFLKNYYYVKSNYVNNYYVDLITYNS